MVLDSQLPHAWVTGGRDAGGVGERQRRAEPFQQANDSVHGDLFLFVQRVPPKPERGRVFDFPTHPKYVSKNICCQ